MGRTARVRPFGDVVSRETETRGEREARPRPNGSGPHRLDAWKRSTIRYCRIRPDVGRPSLPRRRAGLARKPPAPAPSSFAGCARCSSVFRIIGDFVAFLSSPSNNTSRLAQASIRLFLMTIMAAAARPRRAAKENTEEAENSSKGNVLPKKA